MLKLIEYSNRKDTGYIIAGIVDEDFILMGFTVADRNLERATQKNFRTAERAMKLADNNYKGLVG